LEKYVDKILFLWDKHISGKKMNEKALKYWNKFWQGKVAPTNVIAEQFGFDYTPLADELAQQIIDGKKTATCPAYLFHELENEPLPKIGDYTVVLNSKDEPLAIIRNTKIEIIPMNEVTEEMAISEAGSYEYWWKSHVNFFKTELAEYGKNFSEDMLLIWIWFEVVDIK
jgi:uncharacterized protein YhfF